MKKYHLSLKKWKLFIAVSIIFFLGLNTNSYANNNDSYSLIEIDKSEYQVGDTVIIVIRDYLANQDGGQIENVEVLIHTKTESKSITLYEVDDDAGVFIGKILLTNMDTNYESLEITESQTISITYLNEKNIVNVYVSTLNATDSLTLANFNEYLDTAQNSFETIDAAVNTARNILNTDGTIESAIQALEIISKTTSSLQGLVDVSDAKSTTMMSKLELEKIELENEKLKLEIKTIEQSLDEQNKNKDSKTAEEKKYAALEITQTKISPSKLNTKQKSADILLTLKNSNDEAINVKYAELIGSTNLIDKGKTTIPFENELIGSNSTKVIQFSLPLSSSPNEKLESGEYPLGIMIYDDKENVQSNTISITFEEKNLLVANWTGLLMLFAIYYIPAQIIERLLEGLKRLNLFYRHDISLHRERIDSLKAIRKNLINKVTSISTYNEKSQINTPTKSQKKNETVTLSDTSDHGTRIYLDSIELDKKISVETKVLNKETTIKSALFLIAGIGLGLIAAWPLAHYGLGIFQILGMDKEEVFGFDIILNALFIGSGTKPIHDIIEKLSPLK